MLLAIDTATRWTGLALHSGTTVIAELGWQTSANHTVELAPTLAGMLRRAAVPAAELQGIAVSIGPGSYSGLRVGLGLAKGLALANQTPLVGVPTLDIVAATFGDLPGRLIVVAEAGRSRICVGQYVWRAGKGWQPAEPPTIESWSELLERLAQRRDSRITIAGEISPAASRLIRDQRFQQAPSAASVRRAGYLAEIGWRRLRKGQADDPAGLTPIYLRDPAGSVPADGSSQGR
jgi:tRNA threonylcarbamoyladenosine biosynthesis protein TsaB